LYKETHLRRSEPPSWRTMYRMATE